MPRVRTTKALAQRIDLSYFKKPHPFRRARLVLVALCCLGALAWWGISYVRGREMMYNPGPVAPVHAMWASNCAVCHDPHKSGKFSKSVSDESCLQCHDGAIHHPNQAALIALAPDGAPLHAARCASCHVEHRGHEALMASNDAVCTQCHRDLQPHSRLPLNGFPSAIRLFDNTGGHPHFGRSLTPATQPVASDNWVDPTALRFNHQVHVKEVKPADGTAENCTVCHVAHDGTEGGSGGAVAASSGGQPVSWGDGRYMRPIRYARDCAQCHPLQLPSAGPNVPHERMEIVRQTVGNLALFYRQWINSQPAEEQAKLLTVTVPGRIGKKATTKTVRPDEWSKTQSDAVGQAVTSWLDDDTNSAVPGFTALKDALKETGDDHPGANPSALELFVARGMGNKSCAYCHGIAGSPQIVLEKQTPESAATQPSAEQGLLRTVPTGITSAPRRWFIHSEFDHRAHRNLSCVSCHSRAEHSTATSDVLSPDLTWTDNHGNQASCADCHHPATMSAGGATSNCTTCHVYHDRGRERSSDGRFSVPDAAHGRLKAPAPPATQPAQVAFTGE